MKQCQIVNVFAGRSYYLLVFLSLYPSLLCSSTFSSLLSRLVVSSVQHMQTLYSRTLLTALFSVLHKCVRCMLFLALGNAVFTCSVTACHSDSFDIRQLFAHFLCLCAGESLFLLYSEVANLNGC